MKFLLGYNLKIVIQWGHRNFGGGSLLGRISANGGRASLRHRSRENPV